MGHELARQELVASQVQIGLDLVDKPFVADCSRAAQKLVVVKIDINVLL